MFHVRKLWGSWKDARAQAPARIAVALSLGVVLALALYVGLSLLTGPQQGGR